MTGQPMYTSETHTVGVFKYELDQEVWFMRNGKIHSGTVLSRKYVDNKFTKRQRCTKEQEKSFGKLGMEGITYATIWGKHTEDQLYPSRQELGKFLMGTEDVKGDV